MSFLKHAATAALATLATLAAGTAPARAGDTPFVGEIMIVGFNFCPENWLPAEGQILPIAQYQMLYSLLGATYGGDAINTFGLPDLRGRVAISQGTGPGLDPYQLGQRGGTEQQVMTVGTMPSHAHMVNANNADGDQAFPQGRLLAAAPTGGTGNETIYSDQPPNKTMSSQMIASAGSGQPFPVLDPALALLHCIATDGYYPTRN